VLRLPLGFDADSARLNPAGRQRVRPTKRDTVEEIEAPDGSHIGCAS
jgi:hypothetical protein